MTRAKQIVGAAGLAMCAIYVVLMAVANPTAGVREPILAAIYSLAATLCIMRCVVRRDERVPWLLFGLGILSYAAANQYANHMLARGVVLPYPSIADALWLNFYAFSLIALVLLMRTRIALVRSGVWADALVGALALAAVAAAVLVEPILDSTGGSAAAVVTNLAYPLFDVLIIGVIICVSAASGWRPGRTWILTGLAFLVLAAIDGVYLYTVAAGTYDWGQFINVGWPIVMMLIGHAAWQPPMDRRPMTVGAGAPIAIPMGFVLIGFGLTAYGLFTPEPIHPVAAVLALATLAVGTARAFTAFATVRRQIQSHLDRTTQILDSAGEGIVGLDPDLRITFVNRAAVQLAGYSAAELVGAPAHRFHTESRGEQFYGRRKDGSAFPIEFTVTEIVTDGRTTGSVAIIRDISQRQEVDRMKDEFTSIVSHELRTPLTSIRGSLGLLASGVLGPLSDRAQQMVEIAVGNTDRLVRLINDMLDIERMESGAMSLEKEACDAGDLIRQAAATMQPMADAAKVDLLVSTEGDVTLRADCDRMLQTLTNLISNAIKYSDAGGDVDISAERREGEIVFRVRDTGRGIPASMLTAVFERFEQVDASDTREKGGTGLGLAICAGIVEQHGGRIWAESPAGEGATFTFVLPAEHLHLEPVPSTPAGDSRPLVLVCDDDPAALEVISTMVEAHGYRVHRAASGREAVELAARERPDVILLDLLMPRMDGWETASALRRQAGTEAVPVVILSVLVQHETDPVAADVVGWLQKPLSERSLLETLDRAVRRGDQPRRVLVVEDDRDLAQVLRAGFEHHGIETHHAISGTEAMELADRVSPELIVLDLGLPGCDGFSVVEWLRRHEALRSTALLVYSARELDAHQRDQLRLTPSTEYLVKGRATPALVEQRVLELLNSLTEAGKAVAHVA